jgi:hypothetical protein
MDLSAKGKVRDGHGRAFLHKEDGAPVNAPVTGPVGHASGLHMRRMAAASSRDLLAKML